MKLKNILAIIIAFSLLFSSTIAYMETDTEVVTEEGAVVEEPVDGDEAPTADDEEVPISNDEDEIIFDEEVPDRPAIEYMEMVSENEHLALYMDMETTVAAVRVKATGEIWYTNPEHRNADSIAAGLNREKLAAQIHISYYTRTAQLMQMNNFRDSIHREQFEIVPIDNGIRVNYRIGQEEEIFVLPLVISTQRFEEMVLDQLEIPDRRRLERNYRIFSLERARNDAHRNQMLEEYPSLEEHDLYVLSDGIRTHILRELEELVLFAGYTLEDMNEDHLANNAPLAEDNLEVFDIPLEYILEGDTLVVRIPTKEIEYNHEAFPLYRLQLLEFFGAADTTQEGYILVPDGSGSLIYLNNGKQNMQSFVTDVYGRDRAIPLPERTGMVDQAYLPVFGMNQGDRGFFAIIEDGDAVARIWADVSGRLNSYNNVFTEYTLLQKDELQIGEYTGLNTIMVHQPRIFDGDIKMRYAFLSGDDATYSGMARYYRNYLETQGLLSRIQPEERVPFYLEVVGAIDKMKPILGIPVRQLEALTGYDDAVELLKILMDEGIDNIRLRYTGWSNRGINHTVPTGIRLIGKLGGRRAFNRLVQFAAQNDIDFFPEMGLMYAYSTRWFDGFQPRAHASRFINRVVAAVFQYNPATFLEDYQTGRRYVISPARIPALVNGLINGLNRLSVGGVATKDAARDLSADYREKNMFDRQQASRVMGSEFEKMQQAGFSVMADGGNAYALPYVDHILGMSLESNRFLVTDESVPFFQMVVRGYVEYAGLPLNLSREHRKGFLKTVETGANLYFRWIYNENALVKHTNYDYLYSAEYSVWLEDAVDYYTRANEALGDVHGETILDHRKLADDVYMTTFENGKAVAVNYNSHSVTIDGLTIDGLDFLVVKEGN